MTPDISHTRFEDRLLDQLKQVVAENPTPIDGAARYGRPRRVRVAFVGVPVALAAAAIVIVVPSLDGSRTGTAQAAVLKRAAAALDQTNTIFYLQARQYSAVGGGPCMPEGVAPFLVCAPSSAADAQTGISANPADDTLRYSSQEWLSADGSQDHTIYSNGYETVNNTNTKEYMSYDAADNTLTTLTDTGDIGGPITPGLPPLGQPTASDFANPSYYESFYQEAEAGQQNTQDGTTVSAQLVGQTTIAGESVYELRFDFHFTPPANPPAGDICGSTVCTPPDRETLLYLDSQTFLPVRSVELIVNPTDKPGIPPGTAVWTVTDLSIQSLPDTTANENRLQMSSHPGATQIDQTETQNRADLRAYLNAQIAANGSSADARSDNKRGAR